MSIRQAILRKLSPTYRKIDQILKLLEQMHGNYVSLPRNPVASDCTHVNISYSQYYEDIVLFKFLSSIEKGFYIDVGANHPVNDSVTKLFYDRGWSGINVEPLQEFKSLYETMRPRDIFLCVAVSDIEEEKVFYANNGLSTFDKETVERIGKDDFNELKIKTVRLDRIIEEHACKGIHFLKIDVEAHEKNVLNSISLNKFRPWVIAVESTMPCTLIPSHQDWEPILLENNYKLLTTFEINRYYAANEKYESLLANFLHNPIVHFMRY